MKSLVENIEDYSEEIVNSLPNEMGNDLNVWNDPLHNTGLMCDLVPTSSGVLNNVICRHKRAGPIIIDLGLYMSKKLDVFFRLHKREVFLHQLSCSQVRC